MSTRKTRRVRIKLDYVIELSEPIDGVPGWARAEGLILHAAETIMKSEPAAYLRPGALVSVTLDFRKDGG